MRACADVLGTRWTACECWRVLRLKRLSMGVRIREMWSMAPGANRVEVLYYVYHGNSYPNFVFVPVCPWEMEKTSNVQQLEKNCLLTADSNTRFLVYVSRDMVGFSSSRSGLNICQLVASSMSQCPHRMNKQRAQLYTGGLLRFHPASTQNRRDPLTPQEDNATTQTEFIAIHIRVAYNQVLLCRVHDCTVVTIVQLIPGSDL